MLSSSSSRCESAAKPSDAAGPEPEKDAGEELDLARAIRCADCRHPLTTARERTDAFGAHVHDRVNPAGVAFRIVLFARADGAVVAGASSDEFTWFPHFRWRVAVCGGCFAHVGWAFASSSTSFYGLILDALAEE